MLKGISIAIFVVGQVFMLLTVNLQTAAIDHLRESLRLTQIDVQQATERSLRAERAAMQAKETLDAIQFSSSSR